MGFFFFFSSRRRHTRCSRDWSSDVCSSDLGFGLQPESWRAAALLLPCVPLALVEITPFDGGDELLRLAQVLGIVSLIMPGQRHHRAMMKIVIPERVDAIAPLLLRPHQLY